MIGSAWGEPRVVSQKACFRSWILIRTSKREGKMFHLSKHDSRHREERKRHAEEEACEDSSVELEGTEGSSQRAMGLEGQADIFIIRPVRNRGHKTPGGVSDRITSTLQTDSGRSVLND